MTTSNYYDMLDIDEKEVEVLQGNHHDKITEYVNMGASIGGGFTSTLKLKVMKYHEAINGPNGEAWKVGVKKEHQKMLDNGVFLPVKISELPKGLGCIFLF